jgi:hypothetical protein
MWVQSEMSSLFVGNRSLALAPSMSTAWEDLQFSHKPTNIPLSSVWRSIPPQNEPLTDWISDRREKVVYKILWKLLRDFKTRTKQPKEGKETIYGGLRNGNSYKTNQNFYCWTSGQTNFVRFLVYFGLSLAFRGFQEWDYRRIIHTIWHPFKSFTFSTNGWCSIKLLELELENGCLSFNWWPLVKEANEPRDSSDSTCRQTD